MPSFPRFVLIGFLLLPAAAGAMETRKLREFSLETPKYSELKWLTREGDRADWISISTEGGRFMVEFGVNPATKYDYGGDPRYWIERAGGRVLKMPTIRPPDATDADRQRFCREIFVAEFSPMDEALESWHAYPAESIKPVTADGLPGYELVGRQTARHGSSILFDSRREPNPPLPRDRTPPVLFLTVLFDEKTIHLLKGEQDPLSPRVVDPTVFQALVQSFRRTRGTPAETAAVPQPPAQPQPPPAVTTPGKESWGVHLNPGGDAPTGKFKAFYINSNDPEKVLGVEELDVINVNYAWSDKLGIRSEDFGAYFVGWLDTPEAVTKQIAMSLSWSNARMLIDGQVVAKTDGNHSFEHRFEKGRHLVEVEFLNNWHTTDFRVTIDDVQRTYTHEEARRLLAEMVAPDDLVWYAGAYESAREDSVIEVTLARSEKPVVLFLATYSAVTWKIENPGKTEIRCIAYGSYDPGTRVETAASLAGVPRFRLADVIYEYALESAYTDHGSLFHVEHEGARTIQGWVSGLTGKEIAGFSGEYGAKSFTVPTVILDAATKERLDETYRRMEEARKKSEESSAGTEGLFDRR